MADEVSEPTEVDEAEETDEELDVWLPISEAAERAEQPRHRVSFWSRPNNGKPGPLERRKNEDDVWTVHLGSLIEMAEGRDRVEKDILPVPARVWADQQELVKKWVEAEGRAQGAERTVEHYKYRLKELREENRELKNVQEKRSLSWWQRTFTSKPQVKEKPAE